MNRRNLLKSALAAPLVASSGAGLASAATNAEKPRMQKPQRLKAGDTIGLIAPASNTFENEEIRFAIDVIESLGFKVREGKHLFSRNEYLAGTDRQRADDVNRMFSDDGVDGIFCLRGGYGTPRILPLLDYERIAANPKVLLGYSDITALLNAITARCGLVSFHGPIARQSFTDYTYREFRKVLVDAADDAVIGSPPPFEAAPGRVEEENRITRFYGGKARGRLVGGNLSLLATVTGTPYEPDYRDCILFIEDVGEAPYRVDRMLTQLWLAGRLQQCAGFVFGKFTDSDYSGNSFSIEEIIRTRLGPLEKPTLRGLMIGHVEDQTVVPLGIEAELDADAGTLQLLEAAVN